MVIVHIANIDTSIIGGVQIAVPKMVKAQASYGEVCLLNTHGDPIDGVLTLSYDGYFDVSKLPKPYCSPDIVVFHELYRFEYISIYKQLVKSGIPYVIIPHGCFAVRAQKKKKLKKSIANICFFNQFIRNARLVQYLSDSEQAMSAFRKCPSVVMGNGVVIPQQKKTSFNRIGIKFVYIGRLEIYIKGLDLLLEAVKRKEDLLRQNGATVEIYGPDYDDEHALLVQMIHKLGIEDLVRVDKEKTGKEKQEILLSADCFIQTSRTEGLPLGPLEALGYGVPCIVTCGVGLGEIIESYGAGYKCKNTVNCVAHAMNLFIRNSNQLETMSRSAIRLIEENYDIDVIAKQTVNMYCSLLK